MRGGRAIAGRKCEFSGPEVQQQPGVTDRKLQLDRFCLTAPARGLGHAQLGLGGDRGDFSLLCSKTQGGPAHNAL